MLAGKKIIIAVSGSIAAYKIAFFVRLLVKEGAEVKVLMTESAKEFITPLTLATLSKNPVYSTYFEKESGSWHNHVELGMWADLLIIAPLSANTLAKMAHGVCDNLLLATYLSAKCPVMVAPAMDLDMYAHPTTQQNLDKLRSYGNEIIAARSGELASGLEGQGRMAEPEELLSAIKKSIKSQNKLSGKRVLITSGSTQEALDPVRYIGNRSSGKMGTALAESFHRSGAEVTVISGPAEVLPAVGHVVQVQSAQDMLQKVSEHHGQSDIVVFAAAVADYRPATIADEKIKKSSDTLEISLVKNPDIAAVLGKQKEHQYHIGFALETNNEEANAKQKLQKKNFDLIVLNSLKDKGAGFQSETNKVTFFDSDNNSTKFELKSKTEVASDIVSYVSDRLK